jgi:hypothetical protein
MTPLGRVTISWGNLWPLIGLAIGGCGGAATAPADLGILDSPTSNRVDASGDALADLPVLSDVADALYLPWDLPDYFEIPASPPDFQVNTPDVFDDCPSLGVANKWAGVFEGYTNYSVDPNDTGTPTVGICLVQPDVGMEFQCVENKWVLVGAFNGISQGGSCQGQHIFGGKLVGDFDPFSRSVDAQIVQGEMHLFGVLVIYYAGNLSGTVNEDGIFEGLWDVTFEDSDINYYGLSTGWGTWTATPVT